MSLKFSQQNSNSYSQTPKSLLYHLGKVELAINIERNLDVEIEETKKALKKRIYRVIREIIEVERKSKEVDHTEKVSLAKTIEVEAKIEVTNAKTVRVEKLIALP